MNSPLYFKWWLFKTQLWRKIVIYFQFSFELFKNNGLEINTPYIAYPANQITLDLTIDPGIFVNMNVTDQLAAIGSFNTSINYYISMSMYNTQALKVENVDLGLFNNIDTLYFNPSTYEALVLDRMNFKTIEKTSLKVYCSAALHNYDGFIAILGDNLDLNTTAVTYSPLYTVTDISMGVPDISLIITEGIMLNSIINFPIPFDIEFDSEYFTTNCAAGFLYEELININMLMDVFNTKIAKLNDYDTEEISDLTSSTLSEISYIRI